MSTAKVLEDILSRAGEDADFRARLLSDPETTLKEEFDLNVPKGMEVKVVEDSAFTAHLVLPPPERLTAKEMMAVGGGWEHQSGGGTDNNWQDHPIFHD